MKKAILLLFTLNSLSASVLPNRRFKRNLNTSDLAVEEYDFDQQKLDHFDRVNALKWKQRFFAIPTYYEQGGPAFLFLNGKSSVEKNSVVHHAGHWMSYAKELNAYCFLLEHRFYGKNWPENGNMIRHLSSEQALADIAYFIKSITKQFNLPEDIKWIVFGSSYAGSLAAWARLKYPHLIYGAVASSAPILAKADFSEYLEGVEKSLNSYDPKCFKSISSTSNEIVRLKKTKAGRKTFTDTFGLCSNQPKIVTDSCLQDLFLNIKNILVKAVEYHDTSKMNISTVCDVMTNSKGKKYQKYARLIELNELLSDDNNYEEDETKDDPWDFQRCSELGMFRGASRKLKLFAERLYISAQHLMKNTCAKFFGPNFTMKDMNEKVKRTNMLYGGLNFNVSNTLFVHGSLDPWHVLGLYSRKNDSLYRTIFIKGTSHAADQLPASDGDIQELKDARKEVLETLKVWLKKKLT